MKSLRNASSLIVIAPNVLPKQDVKVLSLKRSTTTSHFPDAYVFPGGNSDAADHDAEWLSILPSNTLNVPLNIIGSSSEPLSAIKAVSEAMSLRITAIRKTFKECDILLCKRMNDDEKSNL
jgi:8-oxo-dGTP pyrophosphatase MutT (NUDIX family)